MITYSEDGKRAYFNGYMFTKDNKTGYFLSSKCIDGKRRRLHVYVYEYFNGCVPKGQHIHHIDEDKNNNEPKNLIAIQNEEHASLHSSESKNREMHSKLVFIATEAAKEWHKSEEGRKWHSDHAKKQMELRDSKKYVCTMCGKSFETKHIYTSSSNRFCSNNCKSKYRRISGVDDVEKTCAYCGQKYIANKYSSSKYCEKCRSNIR